MKLRVILVCTLLLLAASASFALPICQECSYEYNVCEDISGAFERCRYDTLGNCYLDPYARCSPTLTQSTVLSDWKVTSIDISRPAQDCATITAPAAAAEVPTATPLPQTTELN